MPRKDTVDTFLRLPPEEHAEAKAYAERNGLTMNAFFRQSIRHFLDWVMREGKDKTQSA